MWSDLIKSATNLAYFISVEPSMPMLKVLRGGRFRFLRFFATNDAIRLESNPPLRRQATGLSVSIRFSTADSKALYIAALASLTLLY